MIIDVTHQPRDTGSIPPINIIVLQFIFNNKITLKKLYIEVSKSTFFLIKAVGFRVKPILK